MVLGLLTLVKAARDGGQPAKDEAPPRTAASRIVQVTVYPNVALVTREVDVPAGMGSMELVVNPLPPQTINSSLYSEGSDGIRVLTTRFRTRPVQEDTREEVRKLEDEIKKLRLPPARRSRPTSRPAPRTWPCSASWRTSPRPAPRMPPKRARWTATPPSPWPST